MEKTLFVSASGRAIEHGFRVVRVVVVHSVVEGPARTGAQFGVVVDVSVVHIDLDGYDRVRGVVLDDVARKSGVPVGIVLMEISLVQEEIGVLDVVVVPDVVGTFLSHALKGFFGGCALLLTGDGHHVQTAYFGFGSDPEESFVLGAESHEPRARQRERRIARLDLLDDLVLLAVVSDLERVFHLAQALAVPIHLHVHFLPYRTFDGKSGALFHIQTRKLRSPRRGGGHLAFGPLAAARESHALISGDGESAALSHHSLHELGELHRDLDLQIPSSARVASTFERSDVVFGPAGMECFPQFDI